MKLTRQDKQVINNFADINSNLEFKKNLKTISASQSIIGEYTLQCDEFKNFFVYDTREFLRAYNCFINPKTTISNENIILKNDFSEVIYYQADKSVLVLPKKTIDELIRDKTPETQFKLNFDDLKIIENVKKKFSFADFLFTKDEENRHCIILTDVKNKQALTFYYSTQFKTNRDYKVSSKDLTTINLLISNYDVSIFEEGKMVLLESEDIPLKYLISLDPLKTPDSKKSEVKRNA